ncbi:MAG: Azaleucine resistance protein AzlC [Candidatus Tokpelaia hoelldobleri]|uniref:Azaleucine resistance protein AzlC n=1 Tax=Candidatus Tokpelaia hoelldobleri TaxID=1902579 RepID=A0A1U9JU28_9HYPH|nr:MAG: Azaleucine resistance protein AzlC [Candidatus Tokpelaia hoelldoblerii]
MDKNDRQQFRQGVIACIPTLLGYWAVGFACGAIGTTAGFGVLETALLSTFMYSGSAHFMFYSLAAAGTETWFAIANISLAIAFINLRYLLINTYMAQFFKTANLREKLIGGALTTDETFTIAANHANRNDGKLPFYWLLGLNVTAWLNWIISTIVGCLFAGLLPEWLRDSMGFSLAGMFIGLLLISWFISKTRLIDIAVVAVAIGVIICSHGVISPDTAPIIATLFGATAGLVLLIVLQKRKISS